MSRCNCECCDIHDMSLEDIENYIYDKFHRVLDEKITTKEYAILKVDLYEFDPSICGIYGYDLLNGYWPADEMDKIVSTLSKGFVKVADAGLMFECQPIKDDNNSELRRSWWFSQDYENDELAIADEDFDKFLIKFKGSPNE